MNTPTNRDALEAAKRIVESMRDHDPDDLLPYDADALAVARAYIKEHEALVKIAAFDDVWSNNRLEKHGTYGSFDEPGSVEIARAALSCSAPPEDKQGAAIVS